MEQEPQFKYIVRIANTDVDGNRKVADAIRKIRGIGFSMARAICGTARIDANKKAGNLLPEEVVKMDAAISGVARNLPKWMLNRRKDLEDVTDKHVIGTALTIAQEGDIRLMKQIRSYKGVRHSMGAPVRGQRTRSNFRRNKGKVVGVVKKKDAAPPAKEEKKEKK